MPHETSTVILAGVAHLPKHDPGWGPSLWELLGIIGCIVVYAGVVLTNGLWRVKDGRGCFTYLFGPVILLIGLAMAIVGFGFAFHLL
ncbi:hypothetical protein [Streptomyces natalensis]|uniref:Uncharacterized protein n=1 Tax=Streptomyces natalensis ATCC 27448 TaxID=1240678 RepID=A0A0D7CED0_9ACTN|nr:hypothetical protein [Streptomyces natalensis]KIZ13732.1 hypothetical protein SNA_37675 [Streptomyces natalensis ATCC 27448]